jgi:hypothetical protein
MRSLDMHDTAFAGRTSRPAAATGMAAPTCTRCGSALGGRLAKTVRRPGVVIRTWVCGCRQAPRGAAGGDDMNVALFHGCPECLFERGPEDIYNVGKAHRAACHTHRTSWFLGSNLIGGWKAETEAKQRERFRELAGYRDVSREMSG